MRVALFTHHFLEPTHFAIAQVLEAMADCDYTVYAKRFQDHFELANVRRRIVYRKGLVPGLLPGRFDVVHAIYDGKTALRAHQAAAMADIPFILSFHGGFDTHAKILDAEFRERSRAVAQAAAAVTVPCEQDIGRLRRIGVTRRIIVLPVPVVLSVSRESREADPDKLVVVGRLIPKKGVDVALRAMPCLPGHTLDIIGDGERRPELERLASNLGVSDRVRFLGLLPIAEMERHLIRAFALLHPARVAADGNAEGTPQVILMAQALGVPVVAAESGSLGEIVDREHTGILVPPDDPQALAGAVRRLGGDPELRERLEHLPFAGERSIGNVSARLREIYVDAGARKWDDDG